MNFKKPSHIFALLAGLILLATSIFWATLSARLQLANADQLIDGYLFESWRTFHEAIFPGAHTFLLKWPLFALAAVFGNSNLIIIGLTVVCALVPVAVLATVLFKIERRPAVFGLWCLVLASVLLLVPAQPSPGTLLPVNFAMFTTRNLEYAVYIVILVLLARLQRLRSHTTWWAIGSIALLIASDKLFAPLLAGSVLLVLAFVVLRRRFNVPVVVASCYGKWLVLVGVGILAALVTVKLLPLLGLGHIANPSSASPYTLNHSPKTVVQAVAYAVLSLFTLFGANPAYGHLALAGWPQALRDSFGIGWVGYGVNALLLVALVAGAARFVVVQLRKKATPNHASLLAFLLLGSAAVSTVIYVLTNHYYPADSRYLTIWFFALIIAAAVQLRAMALPQQKVLLLSLTLVVTLPFSVAASLHQYRLGQQALNDQVVFNKTVASQIDAYQVGTIVGNYWDVVPVRQQLNYRPAIVPLGDCKNMQTALTSSAWQRPTTKASVAYLINSAPAATGFPKCAPDNIQRYLGVPTRSISVSSPGHENSWLYIYDTAIHHLVQRPSQPLHHHVKNVATLRAPASCTQGSVMTVVAHEDDDLLFINPDLQRSITAKKCITTVFLTAGDSGNGGTYSQARVSGSEAAYSRMYHQAGKWHSTQYVLNNKVLTVARLNGAPGVTLIFLNLPDGNTNGRGFRDHNYESLAQLHSSAITAIATNDGRSTYTKPQLTAALASIMSIFQPNEVRTQGYSSNLSDGDHSDHHATGYFTQQAFKQYAAPATLKSYIGYPGRNLAANVSGADLKAKEAVFFAYGAHDGAVCDSLAACDDSTAYSFYLAREYSRLVATHALATSETIQRLTGTGNAGCRISGTPRLVHCTTNQP